MSTSVGSFGYYDCSADHFCVCISLLRAQKESRRKLASFAYAGPTSQAGSSSSRSTSAEAKPPVSIKAKVILSAEQQQVLQLVLQEGMSLFFTGSGTALHLLSLTPSILHSPLSTSV